MSDIGEDIPPAKTIGELDLHLGYLRRDVTLLMKGMARREDIDSLRVEMGNFVRRTEFDAFRRENGDTPFWQFISKATRLGAFVGIISALIGGLYAIAIAWSHINKT